MGTLTVLILLATAGNAFSAADYSVCGSPLVSSRIVGGTDSLDGEWPWQVAIIYTELNVKSTCGGSLISQEWVMTAAHCIRNPIQVSNYKVYLGMYWLELESTHTIKTGVSNIIVNSNYSDINTPGDIALVRLAKPVTYTQYIMPICLPSSATTFPCGMECWVTGWGTRSSVESIVPNGILQEVMVPLIDRNTCQKMYYNGGSKTTIQYDQICAGYKDGYKDSCQGDSGGPLVCKVQGVWYQVGVVSSENGCAYPNFPGVYTQVTAYQAWISTYLNVAFNYVSNVPTPTNPCGGSLFNPARGSPLASSRIVGGTDALEGKWPWQVGLIYKKSNTQYLCGGSLISQEWVMTAALCIDLPIQESNYNVYLGMYQLGVKSPYTVIANVTKIYVYSGITDTTRHGDIALVRLATPVTYSEYIMPVSLPSLATTFPCGTECWVTGWGARNSGGSIVSGETLQEVMVPLIDRNTCQKMYTDAGSDITIQYDQICAGYKDGGKGSCQGDSGGPLVCKVRGVWYQVGIVSSGKGCTEPNFPGVYTLVTNYQIWFSIYLNVQFINVLNIPKPTMTCGGNLINPVSSATAAPDYSVCGSPLVSSRIVNGTNSLDGQWPWQVAVIYEGSGVISTCGGSLISPEWVMTAAHCVDHSEQLSNYKVYLGLYQMDFPSSHTIIADVSKIISHPNYISLKTPGDIALVRLATPVPYTQYIRPICLPSSSTTFPCGTECWVTGWGVRYSGGSIVSNGPLQEVMVPLIDHNTCQKMYTNAGSDATIQNDQICAGYKEGGKGSCQGDSGGPLVCKVQGVWYQVGVVSRGTGCAYPNFPTAYTQVTAYQAWIRTYVNVTFNYVSNIPTPTRTCGGSLYNTAYTNAPLPTTSLLHHRWGILAPTILLLTQM